MTFSGLFRCFSLVSLDRKAVSGEHDELDGGSARDLHELDLCKRMELLVGRLR